jgi:guanylate kinase
MPFRAIYTKPLSKQEPGENLFERRFLPSLLVGKRPSIRRDSVPPRVAMRTETKSRDVMRKGVLFVISAPSGAGKSSLIEKIRPLFPDMLYSVSCTTRLPRPNEIEGVHYHFVSRERFQEMIDKRQFLEWKEVHGNRYGTPAQPVIEAIRRGQRMILDIDVQGAAEVFKTFQQAVGIFITAPDWTVLEQRLRTRGTDSEASIRTRMKNAVWELEQANLFAYGIVNDDLSRAAEQLSSIIVKESEGSHDKPTPEISR